MPGFFSPAEAARMGEPVEAAQQAPHSPLLASGAGGAHRPG
jgi:hypothetical protein